MKSIEKITEEAAELEYPNTDDSQGVIDLQYAFMDGAKWERSRNKWISVEDELPPLSHYFDSLSQSVMTCDNHCVLGIGYYNFAFKGWFAGGCSAIVTHWQSLPEAPKQMD